MVSYRHDREVQTELQDDIVLELTFYKRWWMIWKVKR